MTRKEWIEKRIDHYTSIGSTSAAAEWLAEDDAEQVLDGWFSEGDGKEEDLDWESIHAPEDLSEYLAEWTDDYLGEDDDPYQREGAK